MIALAIMFVCIAWMSYLTVRTVVRRTRGK